MKQLSDEWFTARKGRITGSIVGAILEQAPYMSRDDALRSMVRSYHKAESEFKGNIATDWGKQNEDNATAQFEMESGLDVEKVGFFTYEDWLGASPDGKIKGKNEGLEVKCPFGIRKDENPVFKTVQEQPHYYSQMQMELLATGWDRIWFYQWTPHGSKPDFVDKDQEWLDKYLPELRQFYAFYLSELDNPVHLEPLRKEVNTDETKRMIEEIEQLREAEDNAKDRRKEVEENLINACGNKNSMVWGRKITLVERSGSVSYAKAIKDLAPDADLEPYRGKSSEYWKIG